MSRFWKRFGLVCVGLIVLGALLPKEDDAPSFAATKAHEPPKVVNNTFKPKKVSTRPSEPANGAAKTFEPRNAVAKQSAVAETSETDRRKSFKDLVSKFVKVATVPPHKVSWDVVLHERVSKEQLKSIARHLWKPGYKRTFIGYQIKGEGRENGYWATTHWRGKSFAVVFQGLTKEQYAEQQAKATRIERASSKPAGTISQWSIPGKFGGIVTLRRVNGKFYIRHEYPDGSSSDDLVRKSKHHAGTAYRPVDFNGDYWVATSNGAIEAWDGTGKIAWLVGSKL